VNDEQLGPFSEKEIARTRELIKVGPELIAIGEARRDWGGFVRTGGRIRVILAWMTFGAVGIAEWKFDALSTLVLKVFS